MFPAICFQLEVMDECRSSQEVLLWKRGKPAFQGSAVLAKKQSAGYGRRGREWNTGEGNLALSFGIELPGGQGLSLLPFVAGIALLRTAANFLPGGADLRLKWPNDLYFNGKKLAGLISQVRQYAEGAEVVVGIGLNLAEVPSDLAREAIAISAVAKAPEPEIFAHAFLRKLEAVLVEASDYAWVKKEWEKAARLSEDQLYVVGEESSVTPLALLNTGELLVRDSSGLERKLSSEDVSLRFKLVPQQATL